MKCLFLDEDAEGVSSFREGEMPLAEGLFAPPAPPMPRSAPVPCRRIVHVCFPPGWTGPRHPSPGRQVAYCLAGITRVEASNGDTIELRPGDVLWMADVNGPGHVTTSIGDTDALFAIVQLE